MTISYAGLLPRLKAFLWDYLIIAGYIVLLAIISLLLLNGPFRQQAAGIFNNPALYDLFAFLTLVFPVILYFTLQESSSSQATWGKRKIGIRVVKADNRRLSIGGAFLRSVIKYLPWQIAHTYLFQMRVWTGAPVVNSPWLSAGLVLAWVLAGSYLVTMLVTKTHQTPYDWLAGSYVIVVKD